MGKRRQVIQMTQKYDSNNKKFSCKQRKGNEKLYNGNQMVLWHAHMGIFWQTTKIVGRRPKIPWQIIGTSFHSMLYLFSLRNNFNVCNGSLAAEVEKVGCFFCQRSPRCLLGGGAASGSCFHLYCLLMCTPPSFCYTEALVSRLIRGTGMATIG